SQAVYWGAARHEWHWVGFHDLGEPAGRCICGAPIRYEFVLRNAHTGIDVATGSACVQHFDTPMSQEALSAADCFKELMQGNTSRRMNQALREFAHREKLMTTADARYYAQYGQSRPGTNRFIDARLSKINLEFLAKQDPNRPKCRCDPTRFRNFEAELKKAKAGKLFYACRRGRKGCDFFAWHHLQHVSLGLSR
ncbi:unnamed protein product, partial [marine sediment metagenome]